LRESNEAILAPQDHQEEAAILEIAGCGRAFEGHELKIVDPETQEDLPERKVGEILLKGPSLASGYLEDLERTGALFDEEGWLKSGDLGYLNDDGELFICARLKDLIIIHAINYYPQDLEWAASKVEGVRSGEVVAFATHKRGLEREAAVIVAQAEEEEISQAHRKELAQKIRQEVQRTIGITVDEVGVISGGAGQVIPKTASGKLKRQKARALYESGQLGGAINR
jgi:fatty-acyl-CoA synthase